MARSPASQYGKIVEQLESNRRQTMVALQRMGSGRLSAMLARAAKVAQHNLPPANATFTSVTKRQAMMQLSIVTRDVSKSVEAITRGVAHKAATSATQHQLTFLTKAETLFQGASGIGPRIEDAVQLDAAVAGADASVLRRISTDPGHRGDKAQQGVMDRYGLGVLQRFEEVIQEGLLGAEDWSSTRARLTDESTWLESHPRYWAERIVRTECMAAYNRTGHEMMRQAEDAIGECVRILCATFDDRTSWDSYQVHGQVRRMNEPFEDGDGRLYMVPPNRPNDREIVVLHALEWPVPEELLPRSDDEVLEAWTRAKRKGAPPPRPRMSTVKGFGEVPDAAPQEAENDGAEEAVPDTE